MDATPTQPPPQRRPNLVLVHSTPPAVPPDPKGLTAEDLADLSAWMRRCHLHGYRGVEIEPGGSSGQPHDDCYAVVYEPGNSWAAWGIAREAHGVLVWACASGKERGTYRTVRDALRSLPIIWHGRSRRRDEAFRPGQRCDIIRLS